ncbi:hypothetical protein ACFOZ7_05540 [Natribaculum luteum]|uniref:DUF4263 domain-containing protein n=1 Tax=Natribaculum luteum TaxID=1586232 RepID=A0ABD5NXR9_9EURY|nr:hypothetical protein [Natribaculum luteum]
MTVTEDDLTNAIIKSNREYHETLTADESGSWELTICPEAHYNYYGTRGVADLFIDETYSGESWITIYELKSESAVRGATGANEIVRQFNKMRRHFFKDESNEREYVKDLRFELCFTPSRYTLEHVSDNVDIYRSVSDQVLTDVNFERWGTDVTMRSPDDVRPIQFFGTDWSEARPFEHHAEIANEELFEEYENLFRKISNRLLD